MSIWFREFKLEEIQILNHGTMGAHLGIRLTEIGDDFLKGLMPVDERTRQPMGILHGGASVALAETLGSIAANLVVDKTKKRCVGLEINANHIRSIKEGWVTGIARPVHLGSSTQVWNIEIRDDQERMICISRHTVAVLEVK